MSEELSFQFLADELAEKAKDLGKLGVTLKFVFLGEGVVYIDATNDEPVIDRNDRDADVSVEAKTDVWLKLRAKTLAPHVAAMTRKIKLKGDIKKGMALAPKIMKIL